jgi:AbrB family looped-hinge helix DNA binding protein
MDAIKSAYTVKVSPKFQIVIPKKIREELDLKPGEELTIFALGRSICVQRPRSIESLRGIAHGIKWEDKDRDRKDRF